jgi:hypothetical protein
MSALVQVRRGAGPPGVSIASGAASTQLPSCVAPPARRRSTSAAQPAQITTFSAPRCTWGPPGIPLRSPPVPAVPCRTCTPAQPARRRRSTGEAHVRSACGAENGAAGHGGSSATAAQPPVALACSVQPQAEVARLWRAGRRLAGAKRNAGKGKGALGGRGAKALVRARRGKGLRAHRVGHEGDWRAVLVPEKALLGWGFLSYQVGRARLDE